MNSFKCSRCEKKYDNYDSLRKHNSRTHQISSEQFFTEFNLDGIRPTCKCGCGECVSFRAGKFQEYILGHHARVANNYHKDPSSLERAHETRRQRLASGELVTWNKGLTKETNEGMRKLSEIMRKENSPNRARLISKTLSGKPKKKESVEKLKVALKKYWTPERKEERSHQRMLWIQKNGFETKSKTEKLFRDLLDQHGIEYYHQFYVREIKALYDFKIRGLNILIEVDGDYWHCNESKGFFPKYAAQKKNLERDVVKTTWCESNGYKLIRIWESDLNENPNGSIKRVVDEITKSLLEFHPEGIG